MAAKAGGSGVVVVVVVVDVVGVDVVEGDVVEVEVAAAFELEQPASASAPARMKAAATPPRRSRPWEACRRGRAGEGEGVWSQRCAAEGRITAEAYETPAPVRPPGAGASLASSEQVCASQHLEEPVERSRVGERVP